MGPTPRSTVSRSELIGWLNETLDLSLTKIDQLANGAVLSQLIDAHYPGSVQMKKLNFDSRTEYENTLNFKVMQNGFKKAGIDKDVDVIALSKGNQVDLLEFLQWLHASFQNRRFDPDYKAEERRAESRGGKTFRAEIARQTGDGKGRPQSAAGPVTPPRPGRVGGSARARGGAPKDQGMDDILGPVASGGAKSSKPAGGANGGGAIVFTANAKRAGDSDDSSASNTWRDQGLLTHIRHDTGDGGDSPVQPLASSSAKEWAVMGVASGVFATGSRAASREGRQMSEEEAAAAAEGVEMAEHAVSVLLRSLPDLDRLSRIIGQSSDSYQHRGKLRGRRNCMHTLLRQTEVLLRDLRDISFAEHSMERRRWGRRAETLQGEAAGIGSLFTELCEQIDRVEKTFQVPEGKGNVAAGGSPSSNAKAKSVLDKQLLDKTLLDVGEAHARLIGGARKAKVGQLQYPAADYSGVQPRVDTGGPPLVHSPGQHAQVAGGGRADYSSVTAKVDTAGTDLGRNKRPAPGALPPGAAPEVTARSLPLAGGGGDAEEKDAAGSSVSGSTQEVDDDAQEHVPQVPSAPSRKDVSFIVTPASKLGEDASPTTKAPKEKKEPKDNASAAAAAAAAAAGEVQTAEATRDEPAAQVPQGAASAKQRADEDSDSDSSDDGTGMKDGKRHGLYRVLCGNGDWFEGNFNRGLKHREGMYNFANGDKYEGQFTKDMIQGHGVYTFVTKGRYEGAWHRAMYHGHGMETWALGTTYIGTYNEGIRIGYGVSRYFNGDYYEGEWRDGRRDGRGMQQCTDDSNFVGDYSNGKRHGWGVYSFANGDTYSGEYRNDNTHGHGVYSFVNGQLYEGEWTHGKKHGKCVYTIEDGKKWAGVWEQGELVWARDLIELKGEEPEEYELYIKAAQNARAVASIAAGKAELHWAQGGDVQKSLREAVEAAEEAAKKAQDWAQRMRDIFSGRPPPETTAS